MRFKAFRKATPAGADYKSATQLLAENFYSKTFHLCYGAHRLQIGASGVWGKSGK